MDIHDNCSGAHKEDQLEQRVVHHMQHRPGISENKGFSPILKQRAGKYTAADADQYKSDLGHG